MKRRRSLSMTRKVPGEPVLKKPKIRTKDMVVTVEDPKVCVCVCICAQLSFTAAVSSQYTRYISGKVGRTSTSLALNGATMTKCTRMIGILTRWKKL